MAKVIAPFHYRNDGRTYLVGDEFDGADAAVSQLAEQGFLEAAGGRAAGAPGAAGPADLGGMTVGELRALAAERGVDVPAKAKKAQLVAAIEAAG